MIDILLATYNGEKFLDTQIASIVNQTYKNWKLYIHDDGSIDNSIEIIKKWVKIDNRIIFIDDSLSYHNSGKNFLSLLKKSTSDYICFADQDDYWLDYKLEKMIEVFNNNVSEPLLVCSPCYLWDMKTGEINKSTTFKKFQSINQVLFGNGGLQGCSMMFNAGLRDLLLLPGNELPDFSMHDFFVTLIAICFGKLKYIDEGLILYRNHEKTVTVHRSTTKRLVIKDFLKGKTPVVTKNAYTDIKLFYSKYGKNLREDDKKSIIQYLSYPELNKIKRFILITFSKFSLGPNGHIKLIIKILLRTYLK